MSQVEKGERYCALQPVYSLNLVNDIFERDTPEFIHNYRIVHDKDSNKVIEGLHFTFIELPKFTPHSISDKRMMVLWLRFLTEINANTQEIPSDLLRDPEIGKAVEELKISGFTDAELRAYDKFWDSVRVEKTLQYDSYQQGMEKGIKQGMEKGIKQGMEEGMAKGMEKGMAKGEEVGKSQRSIEIAKNMLAKGMDAATVMEITGLTESQMQQLM